MFRHVAATKIRSDSIAKHIELLYMQIFELENGYEVIKGMNRSDLNQSSGDIRRGSECFLNQKRSMQKDKNIPHIILHLNFQTK
jgi:hypothetical protein